MGGSLDLDMGLRSFLNAATLYQQSFHALSGYVSSTTIILTMITTTHHLI